MERWPISPRRVAIFVGILILFLMVIDFNTRLEELTVLRRHASALGGQATEAVQTQAALQTQVAYAGSDQAVEDWARGEGHYALPEDHAVVPVGEPGTAPILAPSPAPAPPPRSNWQVWWDLFFGQ